MNYELFIARRLFGSPTREGRISKPAVTIAQWGVAVGIVVMIVSVCIVVGFKHEVRDKIIGFGSHIQVSNYYESDEQGELPVTVRAEDLDELARVNGIAKVQTFVSKTGLIAAGEEFEGIVVKGIGSGYDTQFFASHIVEGTLPNCVEQDCNIAHNSQQTEDQAWRQGEHILYAGRNKGTTNGGCCNIRDSPARDGPDYYANRHLYHPPPQRLDKRQGYWH